LGDRKGIQFVEDCIIKCIIRRGNGEKNQEGDNWLTTVTWKMAIKMVMGVFLGKHFNQVPSKFHFIIKKQV